MIDVTVIPSPFELSRRRRLIVGDARTVGDLLDREFPHLPNPHVVADGHHLDRESAIPRSRKLVIVSMPAGAEIGVAIISAIVSTVVGAGISFLVGMLFGQPDQPTGADTSPTYGWDGIRNTRTQGSPIPRVYGEHRVGGQILSAYRRCASADSKVEKLFVAIGLGSGPLTSISGVTRDQNGVTGEDLPSDMWLNGLEASTFDAVTAWFRMGAERQPVLPTNLRKVIQPYTLDQRLTDEWTEYAFHQPVVGSHLNLRFPRGLYYQGNSTQPHSVSIEVEMQLAAGGEWQPVTGSPFEFTDDVAAAFNRTIFIDDALASDFARLRYRRTDAPQEDSRYGDEIRATSVNEITGEDAGNYGGTAVVGLEIDATDQLSGGIPLVTNLVRGVEVPVYDGDLSTPELPVLRHAWSRNPAWIVLDILLDKESGLGNFLSVADIDLDSFASWAAWNDENLTYAEPELEPLATTRETLAVQAGDAQVSLTGDAGTFPIGSYVRMELEPVRQVLGIESPGGGVTELLLSGPIDNPYPPGSRLHLVEIGPSYTEPRNRCDIVFDQEVAAWEAVERVAKAGRAKIVMHGSRFRARFEKESIPVQHIDESAMIADTLEIDYVGDAEQVDVMEIQFLDRDQDYDQSVEVAGDPYASLDREIVRQTTQGYGITNARHARREARYLLNANRMLWKRVRFELPLVGVAIESGDVISVGTSLPGWGSISTRAGGRISELVLDHSVVLEADTVHTAVIVTPDRPEGLEVEITSPAGVYPSGSAISTNGPLTPLDGAMCLIQAPTSQRTEWRVTTVEVTEDLTASIEAVQYEPNVYELTGWTAGFVSAAPGGGGCLSPGGTYLIGISSILAQCVEPTCGPGTELVAEYAFEITINGDLADCATVHDASEQGIVLEVGDCGPGTLSADVTITAAYSCCPEGCPGECLCSPVDDCVISGTIDLEVC